MKKKYLLTVVLLFLCFPSTIYASSTINDVPLEKNIEISDVNKQDLSNDDQELEGNNPEEIIEFEGYEEEEPGEVDSEHSSQQENTEAPGSSEEEIHTDNNESELEQEEAQNEVEQDELEQDDIRHEQNNEKKKEIRQDSRSERENTQLQSSSKTTSQKSADEWYREAMNERTASGRVNKFIEALKIHENNTRLLEGLNNSVENLLDWASNQQNKGNYETAIDRYNLIIDLNGMIDQYLIDEATWKKSYAEEGQKIPSPEQLYEKAMNIPFATQRFTEFMNAYQLYPENSRIIEGAHSSAETLLIWARGQHENGNFTTAIDRYEKILNAPALPLILEESVNRLLGLANNREEVSSLNSLIDKIDRQTTVSSIFRHSKEAYILYPESNRLKNQLNNAAQSLLDWALVQHEKGSFSTAIQRYDMILDTPFVHASIRKETEKLRQDADIGKRSADTIYREAQSENRASYKLNLFVEGYHFYPNDHRFRNGIEESARALFNWAVNKHHAADYETAISRYENILDAPTLSETFRNEVSEKLENAKKGKRPADIIYEMIQKERRASRIFDLNVEGLEHYPDDQRFIKGLEDSSKKLLDLAIRYHENSSYSSAHSRYEKLRSIEEVPTIYREVAKLLFEFTKENRSYPLDKEIDEFAKQNSTITSIFESYIAGYYLYPNSELMIEGMTTSSLRYYDYAYRRHEIGEYQNAMNRYQRLMSTAGVPGWLVKVAEENFLRAKEKEAPENQFVQYTEYQISLDEALNMQMNAAPQTDNYRNKPAYISSQHVELIESGVITGNGVNLRTSPHFGDNVYVNVGSGTRFELIREVDGDEHVGSKKWYRIKYNGQTLYVHSSLANPNGLVARVTQSTKIRANMNPNSHVYGDATRGSEYRVVNTGNNWHQISYSGWRNPTREDVIEYLDPSNFMFNERQLFQFLDLSKPSGATVSILNKYLSNKGTLKDKGQSFIEAGQKQGVNEIYLISHALLETGHGTSDLAKGVEVGKNAKGELVLVTESKEELADIKKVYNMFGIGAVDKCPIECGAKRAYEEGWTTPEAAIKGGAAFIGNDYIKAGQNTLYKMRWNPEAMAREGKASHQYATDIGWAYKQVDNIYNIYQELGFYILHLDIPIYKN